MGFKVGVDKIDGCFEMGVDKNMYDARIFGITTDPYLKHRSTVSMFLRKWYVQWHVNDFITLLLGKDCAPTNFFISNQTYYGS